jgi:Tol biopolymer transport system component
MTRAFSSSPLSGGAERKLASAYGWRLTGVMPHAVDWSRDGGTLAVVDKDADADPWSIYLLSVDSGQRRQLTFPPASSTGDYRVAFSPDGKRVAFVRGAKTTEIYTQSVDARETVRVASNVEDVAGLAWTPNGRELLFSSAKLERSEVWRVPVTGGVPTRVPALGGGALELSVAHDGTRIAFARVAIDSDIFRMDADPQSVAGGFLPPKLFASSTRIDGAARFSPDATRVVFHSRRSGQEEIWVCSSTGDAPMPLTNFNGPDVGSPAWSPDGTQIAFIGIADGRSQLYTINSAGGQPRIVFADDADAQLPEWSPDGRWLYFTSRRTGIYEIWRVPVGGGQPEQITTGGGASLRFVGQEMYYAKEFETSTTLWKLASSGVQTKVFETPVFFDSWTATDRGIYYVDRDSRQIRFFDPVTDRITTISSLGPSRPDQLITRLDVSSDHHSILYTERVRLDLDLMLAEGFR